MIRAGIRDEIILSSGNWLILDIGFANKSPSCGLKVNCEMPVELKFNAAVERICNFTSKSKDHINLLIEAPLSVAFDKNGNPTGRAVEKQAKKTRYWYFGPGCTVMVAALYLVRAIIETPSTAEIRLFEGFVSFKAPGSKSDNIRDINLLRQVIENPSAYSDAIIGPEFLKMTESDTLQSAFLVAGIDAGVPPIIMRNG
jgi:hypothetical protein